MSTGETSHPPEESLPWAAGPYSIKRHGVSVTNCDSEPVQMPGCVQAHGALLVLEPRDLTVLQVSENSAAILGLPPPAILGRTVACVLGDERAETLRAFIAREPIEQNPLYAFSLPAQGDRPALDLTVHAVDGVVIVELEALGRTTDAPLDYYAVIHRTAGRLQATATLDEFTRVVADEVRALSGLDRVVVYRFHEDGHGEVIAESKADAVDSWMGLHYPSEDIPRPARAIFERIWIRPVPDVHGELAELVPLARPDTGAPLTMTWCALRGASIMYVEYLRNLRVTAALTLALRRGDQLWGMIAGHHYGGPHPFPFQVRAACELVAQLASLQLPTALDREHLDYQRRLQAVQEELVARAAQEGGLSTLVEERPSLLDAVSATGAAIYHRERWWRVGVTPTDAQLDGLAAWLQTRPELDSAPGSVFATDSLAGLYPPAEAFADVASGLLAVSLGRLRREPVMWFRPETIRTINWAGDPHDKPMVPGPHGPRLTPRASFELFKESVRLRARPWLSVELDAARRFRVLLLDLVVARAQHLALLNAELSRSNDDLDAFAYVVSHDLKEPLRGIHKYAHQLLDEAADVDGERRHRLDRMSRLVVRMDSLLDTLLYYSRVGRTLLEVEQSDLNEIVAEAVEMVSSRTQDVRRVIALPRPLPVLACDRVRCREIFVNLLSNALKYNAHEQASIEVGWLGPDEPSPASRPAEVAGQTILYVKDDGIGIHPRHFDMIFRMFKRLHGREEYGGGTGAGLAIAKKLVERHHGRIWLESQPGVGTTFFFTLGDAGVAR